MFHIHMVNMNGRKHVKTPGEGDDENSSDLSVIKGCIMKPHQMVSNQVWTMAIRKDLVSTIALCLMLCFNACIFIKIITLSKSIKYIVTGMIISTCHWLGDVNDVCKFVPVIVDPHPQVRKMVTPMASIQGRKIER